MLCSLMYLSETWVVHLSVSLNIALNFTTIYVLQKQNKGHMYSCYNDTACSHLIPLAEFSKISPANCSCRAFWLALGKAFFKNDLERKT